MVRVPFCEACDRHWTPTSMRPDGSCPACDRVLPVVEARRPSAGAGLADPVDLEPGGAVDGPGAADDDGPTAPWHFKLMLVALAVYLAWRGVQGVGWLVHHL